MDYLLSVIRTTLQLGFFVGIPLYLSKVRTKTAKNVVGGLLIFVGFSAGILLWMYMASLQIPSQWQETKGEITQSSYRESTEYYSGMSWRRSMPRVRTKTVFSPNISYTYVVGKDNFKSEKISFRELRFSERGVQKFIAAYPAGASVRVYFKPSAPDIAVIDDSGANASEFLWLLVFMGYVALGWYVAFIKEAKKPFLTAEELLVLKAENSAREAMGKSANPSLPTKIDINAVDTKGRTELINAVLAGASDKVQEYIQMKADVNIQDNDGKSALFYAKALGFNDVVHFLQEAGGKE